MDGQPVMKIAPAAHNEPDDSPMTFEVEEEPEPQPEPEPEPEPELPTKYSGEQLVKSAEMMLQMAETHDLGTVKILHTKDMLHHAKKAAIYNKRQGTITVISDEHYRTGLNRIL